MKNTITDFNGRRTEIKDGELYTVIYCTPARPFHLVALTGLYHNRPDDEYIGHGDEAGYCPHNQKVYLDNYRHDDTDDGLKLIRRVYTDKEWQEKLDELVR